MLLRITRTTQPLGGRANDGGAEMDVKQPALNIRAPVWAREPAARPQSIPQALEALAQPARYQRDEEIYSLERSVECWYRVVSGAARRFALRADGRRQTVDLLLPGDFFGFGVHGKHAFTAEAIADDTVIARYPVSRMEMLAAVRRRRSRRIGRHHLSRNVAAALLAFDPRPHHRGAEGWIFLAAHTRTRRKWHNGPNLTARTKLRQSQLFGAFGSRR